MALTADRDTPERSGVDFSFPVAAATKIYAGALVCLNAAGNAVPGATSTTLIAVGRADEQVDNTGGAIGDKVVAVRKGVFRFNNSTAGDAITKAEIGDSAYIVDDARVAKTNGTNTRSVAGKIVDVDADGVWVQIA